VTLEQLAKKIEEYPFESQGRDLRLWPDWRELKIKISEMETLRQYWKMTLEQVHKLCNERTAICIEEIEATVEEALTRGIEGDK
jgi:hypothetical protein